MAVGVGDEFEDALNLVVSTLEQSSNIRKALKENFLETVRTLRQLFVKIKISGDRKISEINNLTKNLSKLETEFNSCREKQTKVHQKPSLTGTTELGGL